MGLIKDLLRLLFGIPEEGDISNTDVIYAVLALAFIVLMVVLAI